MPAAPPTAADPGLHVTLTWAAPVDLDLYLTDPAGESLYFANTPTRAGARLAGDARCAGRGGGPASETALAPAPAAGIWRVGVDFMDGCGSGLGEVPFRVAVDLGGARREVTGVARAGRFAIVVVEIAVDGDGRLVP
ncbi:MAG: hypothetical protein U0802_18895 [Candidatus Binatia bacterium]